MKKKKHKDLLIKRRSIWERLFFILMFLFLLIWSALIIYMMGWTIISSFKTNMEYVNSPISLPEAWQFGNIGIALEKMTYNDVGFW